MSLKSNIKILSSAFVATLIIAPSPLIATQAMAASTDKLVDMCIEAMDDQSIAKADENRTKLKKVRGGGLKRLTLNVMSLSGDGASMVVECHVRGGEVVDLKVK